jgi:heme-degrading monooxygenase HmoA
VIARVWKGRTAAANAEAYGAFLKRTAHPDYGGVDGNRGWLLLRRDEAEVVEFTLVSLWESMDAVHRYAGPHAERPKCHPEDEAFLLEPRTPAEHFEVVDAQGLPGRIAGA